MRPGGARTAAAEAPPTLVLQLATYADPAEMARWLADATPGAVLVYATAPAIGTHPAARLARDWVTQGKAELFQRRATRPHAFDYCARKITPSPAGPQGGAASPEAVPPDPLTLPIDEARVFQLIAEAVRDERACPSLSVIAHRCLLKNRRRAQYLVERLIEQGLIERVSRAANAPREAPAAYRIAASGLATSDTETGESI